METEALENLGLTRNEALSYVALVRNGSLPAGMLTKHVELHRSRVYEALGSLEQKGLVTISVSNGVQHFTATEPEALLEIAEKHKESITHLIPKLQQLTDTRKTITVAESYVGLGGVKAALAETLTGPKLDFFGTPTNSLTLLGATFWKNYNQKILDRSISMRGIFNEDLRSWSRTIQEIDKRSVFKFFHERFDPLTEIMVLPDKVVIIVWSSLPVATIIRDKDAAASYRQFFEILWDQAKE